MHKKGNWLVTYFQGVPDMWATKPPLMIWLQCTGMHLFGVNELAVRLPSALAGFFTCLMLVIFAIKWKKDSFFGIIAVMVLITSEGYIGFHSTRTGDYDSLLALFMAFYSLAFFSYCDKNKPLFIYLTFA